MMDTQSRTAVRIFVQQVDSTVNESERGNTSCLPIKEEADLVSVVEDVNSILDDKEVNANHESVPTPTSPDRGQRRNNNLPDTFNSKCAVDNDLRRELMREVTRKFLSRTQNNRGLLPGYAGRQTQPVSKLGSSRDHSIDLARRRISHRRQVSSDTILSGVSINRFSALAQQTEMSLRGKLHSVRMAMRKENVIQTYERTFDEWVVKNIQVRECYKFVKEKDDVDNDPICHCKNKLSKHPKLSSVGSESDIVLYTNASGRVRWRLAPPQYKLPSYDHFMEMPEESSWTQNDNTMLTKNNAFGKITFDVEECSEEAQYMRIAKDYSEKPRIEILKSLFADFWKLDEPDLLISVSGGAKSFNVPQDICASFQQGLLNAARSTRAWIITGGQHCGVMKLVGGVIGQSISTTRIPTIGVGNWGKTWKNNLLVHNRSGHYGGQREATTYPIEPPDKGYATLDPNHTHHFLVDDGTTGTDGIEYEFRAALETLICEKFMIQNVPLPMVCIMVEGGMRSLEIAISTLRKGTGNTLVVLKGSGRASDILCYGFENSIEIDSDGTGGRKERKMPAECDVEIKRLIEKDFGKYKIEKQMLDLILEISAYRDFVTIYSIQNPEPLDFYILSSLMKSSANANVLAATKMRQMRLAITWGHAKIAREFIFSQKLYKFSAYELEQLMLFAITKQRTEFVKLLMDYGCDLKQFLTAKNLKILFNSLDPKSGGYRLLMEKAERKLRKMKFDGNRNVEEGPGTRTPEIQLSEVGSLLARIMQGSYTSIFNTHKKKYENGAATFDNPFDLMTVYCALDNCQDMALLFWKKSRTPMATGIIAHRIYNYLDMMESKWARMDEEMTEQLEKAASDFESLSYGLMTMCYHNYEKKEWVNILEVKMIDWGNLSLFEIGQITGAKNFLSHAAYQSYLTDIWMGEVHPSTPFFLLAFCAVLPPLPIFLKYNSKFGKKNADLNPRTDKSGTDKDDQVGKKPNPLRRLQLFYTSPAVKFILNGITYLIFLGLYICSILEGNECNCEDHPSDETCGPNTNMVGWKDYYLIIFVGSTIPIEISQFTSVKQKKNDKHGVRAVIDGNTKSVLKKFKIYFKQMYNVVDLLAIIVFTIAFTLKLSVKCNDDERYMIYKFSNYHYFRLFSSFCFILYSLRFIQMFEMNAKIGPKIFMLKRMAVDLFFFLFLLAVFTFSYCVASEALLYPFHDRPVNETIFTAFRRSYFNVFGDLDIEGLSNRFVTGHCNEKSFMYMEYHEFIMENHLDGTIENLTDLRTRWEEINEERLKKLEDNSSKSMEKRESANKDPPTFLEYTDDYCERWPEHSDGNDPLDLLEDSPVAITNYYICFMLLCIYVLTVNIMLINLLIAIFSNTYSDSKAKSGIIYKTQRASVIVEFEERPWLPNPLSLIYFACVSPFKMLKSCCGKQRRYSSARKDSRKASDSNTAARARRAQLIEAECMVLHLKKETNKKDGLVILEAQNKKISSAVEKIVSELKQITLKQHKETLWV
ncbi:transient receptor potential cation channel subfamily M member 3-like isoform X7 [Bolinopsis microptera]|uniref:transient receptor potential cation channel subfamily M member 3-like isoform X7 n=1 Tax=Bolinopsis microptera TaxID=2820187 RepID=UPI00307972BE